MDAEEMTKLANREPTGGNAEEIAKDTFSRYSCAHENQRVVARALLDAIAALQQIIFLYGESFEQTQIAREALAKIRGGST